MDEGRPIFVQIAEQIENDIIGGVLAEESQVPSTNEFAAFLRINPATAGKALNLLVDREVLVKRRGIGMFVAEGARSRIMAERTREFVTDYISPLLAEAAALGLSTAEVIRLIDSAREHVSRTEIAADHAERGTL